MSKILVIEDEAAIRRVLVKILSEENEAYKVDEIITVTQESGRWKVCGGLFNFTENSST